MNVSLKFGLDFNILILVSEVIYGFFVLKYFEEFLFRDFKLYLIKTL